MINRENHSRFGKITIVLVPDAGGDIKSFSLSKSLLTLVACLLVFSGVFLTWLISDHQWVKDRNERLVHVQRENKEHHREFLHMAGRIAKIKQEADELKIYYEGIKSTLDRVAGDRQTQFAGIGGSDSGLFQADFSAKRTKTQREFVRFMHRSLDNLNEELQTTKLTAIEVAQFLRHTSWEKDEAPDPPLNLLDMHDEETIRKQLKAVAIELGLEPSLALGMAKVESGYNPKSVSPKGAVGVLQVMPRFAWHEFNVNRQLLFNPHVNIRLGLSRMKYLLNRFDQDLDLALAAYNAGASRVVNAGHSIPRITETQNYVKKVKKAMKNMD
ncbi:MAG: lytic transglycosylase domain-containing protein [Proteobacteria bacterium]|nr:lytic transglycosylase domain-containing protein [Pseudomonadota bacterium]